MNFNFKKIITAACTAAFLATSFLPGISEAANGRMSLAQAQQQVKRPLHRHYKPASKPVHKLHAKHMQHRYAKHRPAMHTRGPVSHTWKPVRHAPLHQMKRHTAPVLNHTAKYIVCRRHIISITVSDDNRRHSRPPSNGRFFYFRKR